MALTDILSSIQSDLAAGKSLEEAAYGSTPTMETSIPEGKEDGSIEVEDGETPEEIETETKPEGEASSKPGVEVEDAVEEDAAKSKAPPDKEVVVWGGREVEIDYSNRDQIKRDKALAIGARKWQAERDAAQAKLKDIEPDYKDAVEFRQTIMDAFETRGLEGLVNLLTKQEDGYQKFLAAEVAKAKQLEGATPEQRAILEERAANERLRRELEADRKRREKEIETAKQAQEKARIDTEKANETAFTELVGLSAKKHSFTGKFENPDLEDALDTKVWNKVRADLSQLPDETELTPQLMDKLFSKHMGSIEKGLSSKISKETEKKVENKKVESQQKVAASAAANMGRKGAAQEFEEAAGKGDFTKAIKMFMNGKVKLK